MYFRLIAENFLKGFIYHNVVGNNKRDGCESRKKDRDEAMVKS